MAQVLAPLALGPLIGIFEFRPTTMLQRETKSRLVIINTASIAITNSVTVFIALNGYAFMSLV